MPVYNPEDSEDLSAGYPDPIGTVNLANFTELSLGTYGTETQAKDENGNLEYNEKTDYF